MIEVLRLGIASLAGCSVGCLFFGALWWTIRHGLPSRRPGIWFLTSPLLRFGGTLGFFYVLAQGDARRLIAGLLGFLVSRPLILAGTREDCKKPVAHDRIPH